MCPNIYKYLDKLILHRLQIFDSINIHYKYITINYFNNIIQLLAIIHLYLLVLLILFHYLLLFQFHL